MDIRMHAHGLEMSDALRDYAERHIAATLANIYKAQAAKLDIEFSEAVGGREKVCKASVFVPRGKTLVASAQDANLFAAVDIVADKISRELRHYKEKRQDSVRQNSRSNEPVVAPAEDPGADEFDTYEQFDTELEGKLVS